MLHRFRIYAWATLALNLIVVLWGAVVRATHSGAGCGDQWPTCQGTVLPAGGSLTTIVEYLHRASSGVALVSVGALAVWALLRFPRGHLVRKTAGLAGLFILTEAALGAGLVLLRMVAHNPAPARAAWMAAHLLNTWMLVASLALTAWFAAEPAPRLSLRNQGAATWLLPGMILAVFAIGMSGAVTAFVDTAFPAATLAAGLAQDLAPDAPWIVRARMIHPVVAFVVGVGLLTAVERILATRRSHRLLVLSRVLIAAYALQMVLGVLNLLTLTPVWMQIVHLLAAETIWLALVLFAATALESATATAKPGSVAAPDTAQPSIV